MKVKKVNEIASNLVEKTIKLHKQNKLNNKSLIVYLNDELSDYDQDYYYLILNYFCKYLSENGYEIKSDTNHFDIINYNSNEYIEYINLLRRNLPKNYNELRIKSIKYCDNLIAKYSKDTIKHSYTEYLNSVIPNTYDENEKAIIEVNIVSRITEKHYDICRTEPLLLEKFY